MVVFALITVFIMLFTFIGCDKKTDEDKNDNTGIVDDENPGGDETEEKPPVSTAVANSTIITDAFAGMLESDYIHVSLKDLTFSMDADEAMDMETMVCSAKLDMYLRKCADGYEMIMKAESRTSGESEDFSTKEVYTSNRYIKSELYYVGGYIYDISYKVSQDIVDGKGYEYFSDYTLDPDTCDAVVPGTFIEDWDKVDEVLGNTGKKNRVRESKSVAMANSLDSLVAYLVDNAPFLEDIGFDNADAYFNVVSNLVNSLSSLTEGETEADENGGRSLEVNINLKNLYDQIAKLLSDNLENNLGALLDAAFAKGDGYAENVVNTLFPAEGKCLTINQFFAELENVLGENEVDATFKEIIDEIQNITGLSTKQIADIVNPLLDDIMPESISVSINPKEGETLYDTLERSVFDII